LWRDDLAQFGRRLDHLPTRPLQAFIRHQQQLPASHRRHLRPRLPGIELRLITGQNHLGIALQHRLHAHLRRWQCQVGKHIARTAHFKRIADDLPTADGVQRPIPDLIEHLQRLVPSIALAQVIQLLSQVRR